MRLQPEWEVSKDWRPAGPGCWDMRVSDGWGPGAHNCPTGVTADKNDFHLWGFISYPNFFAVFNICQDWSLEVLGSSTIETIT